MLLVLAAAGLLCACGGRVAQDGAVADAGGGTTAIDVAGDGAVAAPVTGMVTAPDCPGCTFPAPDAPACSGAPPVKIVYPPDGVLLPPNLGVLSVQWVPYGAPFARFEVDFTQSAQAPYTQWSIVTACSSQTVDNRGLPTGGCELTVDPTSWAKLVAANRGGNPVSITVRGTTGGACASTSADTVHISFAQQDVPGTYFHWASNATPLGTGGQIWRKTLGDPSTPEQNITAAPFPGALCAGCHSVSRDGSRMVVFALDDTDADYGGLAGSYLDTTALPQTPAAVLAAGTQPPGWSAIHPGASPYVSSNGTPCGAVAATCGATSGYAAVVPQSAFALWDGRTGKFIGDVAVGASGTRPTMPDWSADGSSVVYVVPQAIGSWDNGKRADDDHVFGGSLYTTPYTGAGAAGPSSLLVQSKGENNYYPAFSPDAPSSYVLFDRAALDTSVGAVTGCRGTSPQAVCPNDSFFNPAARLMLVPRATGSTPVDLASANGSSPAARLSFANSYPRWVPSVQSYKGKKLYWISFSSTRDYGLRVTNQKPDYFPCYPPDSLQWPGSTHHAVMSDQCLQPQIWMAPVEVDATTGALSADPSGVAFWVPYQDPTLHNHMATWSQ